MKAAYPGVDEDANFPKKGAMKDDSCCVAPARGRSADGILRAGARQLLGQAIEAEVAAEAHADLTDASGRRRLCHGHMPEPSSDRDRSCDGKPQESSRWIQQATGRGVSRHRSCRLMLRRAKSVEALLPWLYREGHLQRRLFGGPGPGAPLASSRPDAPWRLTASTIGRLTAVWCPEYMAKARPFGSALRLFLGRRGLVSRSAIIGADAMLASRTSSTPMPSTAKLAGGTARLRATAWPAPAAAPWASGSRYARRQGAALLGSQDRQRVQPDVPGTNFFGHLHDIWMADSGPTPKPPSPRRHCTAQNTTRPQSAWSRTALELRPGRALEAEPSTRATCA